MALAIQKQKPKKAKAVKVTTRRGRQQEQSMLSKVGFAVLIGAAVLALLFFLVIRSGNHISVAENLVGTILSPIERAFSSSTMFVRDHVNGVRDYFYMTEDLAKTKQELTNVKLQLMEYEQAARENDQLKGLLGSKDRYGQFNPVYARITSRNPGVWFDSFTLNVGTNHGVEANHAVINGDGLVGRVFEVGANYCKVMTIINEDSAVGCLVERTREDCMMYGRISRESETIECQVGRLMQVNAVMTGDLLITSGTDEVYPKGLPVAQVTQVSRQQSTLADRFVYARPVVDFLRIEYVLVLRVQPERDDIGSATALIVETPKPTVTASETPAPTPVPQTAGAMDSPFEYPSGTVTPDGDIIIDPQGGTAGVGGMTENNMLIEDEWAR